MASNTKNMITIKVRSHQREELVEFTDQVAEKLRESKAKEGVVVLYVQHTTAGLTINENADPDVPRDMLHALRTLIPQHGMAKKTQTHTAQRVSLDHRSLFLLKTGNSCLVVGKASFFVSLTADANAK